MPDEHDTNTRQQNTRQHKDEALKLCFDGCKHMSTLSAVGAGALIGVYQEELIGSSLLAGGLVLILISSFVSLVGLLVPTRGLGSGRGRNASLRLSLAVLWFSIYTFAAGVLTITTKALHLPFVAFVVSLVATTIFFFVLYLGARPSRGR